ncbi:hypothetical protein FJZ18_03410 [Candidatus Pacearchaeota archaeon]|nr:hypothetical protein [Candidatus Pacearchaeota archaeon]
MQNIEDSLNWLNGFAKEVAVASTMHEPDQSLLEGISRIAPILKDAGFDWHIAMTETTRTQGLRKEDFYNLLSKKFNVRTDSGLRDQFPNFDTKDKIEANHYEVFLRAARSGKPFILYMDSDRITVGANYYPREFSESLNTALRIAKNGKIVALARSPSAINTHLSSLVLTEGLVHSFYNRELQVGSAFVDLLSTGYLIPSDRVERLLSDYKGGEFLGVRSNYPHSKVILALMAQNGIGLESIQTDNILRYEAPEQMRGAGKINLGYHQWTPAHYDEVTLASRPLQEEIMQNPREWQNRFSTVVQYLSVLDKLWIRSRGEQCQELDNLVKEISCFSGSADEYRSKAVELSKRY